MIFFVCDNGHGFDTASATEQTSEFTDQSSILTSGTHLWVNGMKKRVQILNAELKITSDEECGTEIRLLV